MTIYNVYNHKSELIGAHKNAATALKHAMVYQHTTGWPAYVESEVLCF